VIGTAITAVPQPKVGAEQEVPVRALTLERPGRLNRPIEVIVAWS